MKRLSKQEEVQILKQAIKNNDFLGNGSSRAVFSLDEKYCVKVACDIRGQYQNHNEVETFKEFGRNFLAEVKNFGKYIVVMEKVDAYDCYEVEDLISRYREEDYNCDEEEEEDIRSNEEIEMQNRKIENFERVANELDNILGQTDDNYQLGIAKDGRTVAYDYGYLPNEHSKSVSHNLYYELTDSDDRTDFLQRIIDRLLRFVKI